jgi:hypothetical protein
MIAIQGQRAGYCIDFLRRVVSLSGYDNAWRTGLDGALMDRCFLENEMLFSVHPAFVFVQPKRLEHLDTDRSAVKLLFNCTIR